MPTEKMVTRKDYDQLREELHRARLALNEYARENSDLRTQIALLVDRLSITDA
jgi:hypothetical protein